MSFSKPGQAKKTMATSNFNPGDADLKARLACLGVFIPITNTTRSVLQKKLESLETKNLTHNVSDDMAMDTSSNDLNEYEIQNGLSKIGYKQVPMTDSTRPVLSNMLKKKRK